MCAYQTDHTDFYRTDACCFLYQLRKVDAFRPAHPYKVKCSHGIKISYNITLCRTLVSKETETKFFAIWLCGRDYEFSLIKKRNFRVFSITFIHILKRNHWMARQFIQMEWNHIKLKLVLDMTKRRNMEKLKNPCVAVFETFLRILHYIELNRCELHWAITL